MWQNPMQSALTGSVVNKVLLDRDTSIRNKGVKERIDWVGEFLNDFKTQWNAVEVANPITVDDYDPKDYE